MVLPLYLPGTVAPSRGPQCQPLFVSRDVLGETLCESVYSIVATRPIVKASAVVVEEDIRKENQFDWLAN